MEIWKTITEFDRYQVSSFGRIKCLAWVEDYRNSTRKHSEKILNPGSNGAKYLFVGLYDGEKRSHGVQRYVHRLVVEYFKGGIKNGCVVNHIDGNRQNNHVDNLEQISHRDNCLHGSGRRTKKSSRFPGVHLESKTGYWKAMVRNGGKKIYLGKFPDEESAYEKYKEYLEKIESLKYLPELV